jgi:hypothetical protein
MHQGYFSFQMSLYAGRVRLLVVWPYLPYASIAGGARCGVAPGGIQIIVWWTQDNRAMRKENRKEATVSWHCSQHIYCIFCLSRP